MGLRSNGSKNAFAPTAIYCHQSATKDQLN
jgi:hypothetical protein